ncbi:MAG: exodeoxyribonuclease III [Spirochaetes bacterium]|uniref:Exodeoxyribonuclease III n=1 Tax=Candidatus Ornithospirochaeta stercoripullorum TaxID=2840899 RepID=A0A9D9DZM2_9SPIO|nr:exodeoxyribonuclease III [Candidatus Ornithospirochaeta stercoripullorum]
MRLISWNVNGLRSCLQKGFMDFAQSANASIIALQEVKASEGAIDIAIPGYPHQYFSYADKKGYSGTAIFSSIEPENIEIGLAEDEFNHEGRIITLTFRNFHFICVYVPNSQEGLKRLGFRLSFDDALREHIMKLSESKPVIATGDFNVANEPIDLKNPKQNEEHAGYSKAERESFKKLLASGMIDTFRSFYPDQAGAYSWWSYMFHAREKNAGWRIDYFLASEALRPKLRDAGILADVMGSDHAPVFLDIDI